MNEPTVHLSKFSQGTTMTKSDHTTDLMKDLMKVLAETIRVRQKLQREFHLVRSKEHQRRLEALAQIEISIAAVREAIGILEGNR